VRRVGVSGSWRDEVLKQNSGKVYCVTRVRTQALKQTLRQDHRAWGANRRFVKKPWSFVHEVGEYILVPAIRRA